MTNEEHKHKSWGDATYQPISEVDASVVCNEELGAAEREHVGLQERLVGSITGHVHYPSSAVRTLQLAPEEEMAILDRANQVYQLPSSCQLRQSSTSTLSGWTARRTLSTSTTDSGERCDVLRIQTSSGSMKSGGRHAGTGRNRRRGTSTSAPDSTSAASDRLPAPAAARVSASMAARMGWGPTGPRTPSCGSPSAASGEPASRARLWREEPDCPPSGTAMTSGCVAVDLNANRWGAASGPAAGGRRCRPTTCGRRRSARA
jgi:hypothetical protein